LQGQRFEKGPTSMTWIDLEPPTASPVAPVTACSGHDGRLFLFIRPQRFSQPPPAWLVSGQEVAVQIGTGDFEGELRIARGGKFKLHRVGSKSPTLRLALPRLSWPVPARQKPEILEFDDGEGWISVSLPEWARRPAATDKCRTDVVAVAARSPTASSPHIISDPEAIRAIQKARELRERGGR
jgi:hypothetical protein